MPRKKYEVLIVLIVIAFLMACGGGSEGTDTPVENPDKKAPYVASRIPDTDAVNIGINSQVSVQFNELMSGATIDETTVLVNDGTNNIIGSITYDSGTAIFTPSSPLQYGTTYTVTLKVNITDISGNNLTGDISWSFTTSTAPVPEIHLKKGINNIISGTNDVHDFGNVTVGNTSESVIFTVFNTGSADLNLTGTPRVISSSNEFVINNQPDTPITGDNEESFSISFQPTSTGTKSAEITISSNDSDEGVYTFTIKGTASPVPEPEIHLIKGLDDIPSGTLGAHDFGNIFLGESSSTVIFTIKNIGSADLNLLNIPYVTSSNPEFTIEEQPVSPVVKGDTTIFKVSFHPQNKGIRSSTIEIINNDTDENNFAFTIAGTGTPLPAPEIEILHTGDTVPDGGKIDFGSVIVNNSKSITFTIQNIGNADLLLNGNPKVEIIGDDSSQYEATQQPVSPISQGSNSTFTIEFHPDSSGTRNATIKIINNDDNEAVYEIDITGTGGGCHMLKDMTPGPDNSSVNNFIGTLNNEVYFFNNGLCKTDGTENGTSKVKNIYSGASFLKAAVMNNTLYLLAHSGDGNHDLWKTDGTESNTILVKELGDGAIFEGLFHTGNYICFLANDSGSNYNKEFWYSDGTEAGTHKYECNTYDMNPSTSSSNPHIHAVIGPYIYFSADRRVTSSPRDRELYIFYNGSITRYEGYPGYESSNPNTLGVGIANGYFFFTIDTASGSVCRAAYGKSVYSLSSNESSILRYYNNMYWFGVYTPANGYELYNSNSPIYNYTIVKDVNNGTGHSYPNNVTGKNNIIYFSATDGTHGKELWRSDGTKAGTYLVKDVNKGSSSGLNNTIYTINDTLIFIADDGDNGPELWRSDGSEAGTYMLKDIRPGTSGSNISNIYIHNDKMYFTANDGTHGTELWSTDGTTARTTMVLDINPGSSSSSPQFFYTLGDSLLFTANDGVNGKEIWILE